MSKINKSILSLLILSIPVAIQTFYDGFIQNYDQNASVVIFPSLLSSAYKVWHFITILSYLALIINVLSTIIWGILYAAKEKYRQSIKFNYLMCNIVVIAMTFVIPWIPRDSFM
jgi:hypothetical protein